MTYTNLPAGDYVFQVSASNSDGMWNENAIAFPIKVLPPWWASSYMIAGYILLGIAGLVYAYYRMNKIHRRRMTLLTIKKTVRFIRVRLSSSRASCMKYVLP